VHSGVQYDDAVLSELIRNMAQAAGVLHIVPADFVAQAVLGARDSAPVLSQTADKGR
jgi:hypothetical protein